MSTSIQGSPTSILNLPTSLIGPSMSWGDFDTDPSKSVIGSSSTWKSCGGAKSSTSIPSLFTNALGLSTS